jgi:hypothetical protein
MNGFYTSSYNPVQFLLDDEKQLDELLSERLKNIQQNFILPVKDTNNHKKRKSQNVGFKERLGKRTKLNPSQEMESIIHEDNMLPMIKNIENEEESIQAPSFDITPCDPNEEDNIHCFQKRQWGKNRKTHGNAADIQFQNPTQEPAEFLITCTGKHMKNSEFSDVNLLHKLEHTKLCEDLKKQICDNGLKIIVPPNTSPKGFKFGIDTSAKELKIDKEADSLIVHVEIKSQYQNSELFVSLLQGSDVKKKETIMKIFKDYHSK